MNGSATFKALVKARDWEAVYAEMDSQIDRMHGVSLLTKEDREYIRQEAEKDGYAED
jgi:hypothetical protein